MPKEYLPLLKERFGSDELSQMYHWHALPKDWENLLYSEFLEKRRSRIARVIAEGYQTLISVSSGKLSTDEIDVTELVSIGESHAVEFKSTLRTNMHTGTRDPRMENAILRALAGFLNTNGGTLVVGVADDGTTC